MIAVALMCFFQLTNAESLSDVFGSMVKQWRGGVCSQTASDADWLIGEGIFNPKTGIVALRSLKDPGTAYDNDLIGKDPQVAHMNDYADLPDDEGSDVSVTPLLSMRLLTDVASGEAYISTLEFRTRLSTWLPPVLEASLGIELDRSGTMC